jgi:hypothetical protein
MHTHIIKPLFASAYEDNIRPHVYTLYFMAHLIHIMTIILLGMEVSGMK